MQRSRSALASSAARSCPAALPPLLRFLLPVMCLLPASLPLLPARVWGASARVSARPFRSFQAPPSWPAASASDVAAAHRGPQFISKRFSRSAASPSRPPRPFQPPCRVRCPCAWPTRRPSQEHGARPRRAWRGGEPPLGPAAPNVCSRGAMHLVAPSPVCCEQHSVTPAHGVYARGRRRCRLLRPLPLQARRRASARRRRRRLLEADLRRAGCAAPAGGGAAPGAADARVAKWTRFC